MRLQREHDTIRTLCAQSAAKRTHVSLYVRAVRRAAEIVGIDGLSSLLGRARADVAEWIVLGNPPPVKVFLQAVDVIAAHDVDALRRRADRLTATRP